MRRPCGMAYLEGLEARRLLAGGLDPTFGSNAGTEFSLEAGVTQSRAVDSQGRVLLGGMKSVDSQQRMLVARLHVDGEIDARFGVDGFVIGTPRGLNDADFVVPLRSGGYVIATRAGDERQVSLIRLGVRGAFDASFGGDGVVRLTLNPAAVVE